MANVGDINEYEVMLEDGTIAVERFEVIEIRDHIVIESKII